MLREKENNFAERIKRWKMLIFVTRSFVCQY